MQGIRSRRCWPRWSWLVPAALMGALMAALGAAPLAHPLVAHAAGSLQFAPAVNYSMGTGVPRSVAVGDFNNDGRPDLVVASTAEAQILLNNGDGTYQAGFAISGNYSSVAVGDFNGDGKLDFAVADPNASTVDVFLNSPNYFVHEPLISVGAGPRFVGVADLNGDGHPDLVTANYDGASVDVILNDGTGTFAPATAYPVGAFPGSVAVGDFNGDGKPDLAVANSGSSTVGILTGNGDGTFAPFASYAVPEAYSVVTGDFNSDRHLDLAVLEMGPTNSAVDILLSNGDGTFAAPVPYQAGVQNLNQVAVGDFNGDGIPDLAVADEFNNSANILTGHGDGTFASFASFHSDVAPQSVAVGDFNGDGKPDLAVANAGGSLSALLNTTVFPVPNSSTTTTLAVQGGALLESTPIAPTISDKLTGQDQSVPYQLPISVDDATGTGAGWSLTLGSTQFSTSGAAHTLATTASMMTGAEAGCGTRATCTSPTNGISYPLGIPAGASVPTPVKIFNAAVGTGLGTVNVTPTVDIFVPANTYAGTYTSTLFLAVVAGP